MVVLMHRAFGANSAIYVTLREEAQSPTGLELAVWTFDSLEVTERMLVHALGRIQQQRMSEAMHEAMMKDPNVQ